jgi:Zn-finger nucleic acid-binding protein
MNCIKCEGQLQKILFSPVTGQKISLWRCNVCNGIWIDKETLDQYLDQGSWGIDSWAVDPALMQELDEKIAHCPRCELRLIKAPSQRDPSVTIDFCDSCGSVWLDPTELDQLEHPHEHQESVVDRFLKLIGRY